MADECCDASKIVTAFFLNTCRLHPLISICDVQAAVQCAALGTKLITDNREAEFISIVTGSVAEFYIEPMLPHVGDIDVMFHDSTWLAIPRGHPRQHSYQLSFTTMSRYLRLLTVTYQAMCI